MNHIRYVEYNAVHDGSFVFDVPEGHDCWLLVLTHTPAFFRVDGSLQEYPAKSAVLFPPFSPIYYCACGDRYEMTGCVSIRMKNMFPLSRSRESPFPCRMRITATTCSSCSPGKCISRRT